jgi:hypothetical protein
VGLSILRVWALLDQANVPVMPAKVSEQRDDKGIP